MFAVGTMVAGKYRVERVLGEGGMGIVLAATHVHLGTQVALKVLHPDMARHRSIVERFMREAQASAKLASEHVCRVMDVGTLDDSTPFIVMELLHGNDLASMLKAGAPFTVAQVADYVLQACHAIAEAHAHDIVHRDLKPGNLFLVQRPDGRPFIKVLDFGIAKTPPTRDFSLTQTANVMGSPGYMSPEQLKSSKNADARSDIWSLGVVMYELLGRRQPFTAETITELALRVAMDPTPPLPMHIPKAFVDVVVRCLAKDPAGRYQDVAALAAALAPFTAHGDQAARAIAHVLHGGQPPPVAYPVAASVPTTLRSASGETMPGLRSKRLVGGIVAGGIVVGVVGVVLLMKTGDRNAPAPAPSVNETATSASMPTPMPPTPSPPPPSPPPPSPPASTPPATEKPASETPEVAKPEVAKPDRAKIDAKVTKPVAKSTPRDKVAPEPKDKPAVKAGDGKDKPPAKPSDPVKPDKKKPTVEEVGESRM